jgi:hypothetical protein
MKRKRDERVGEWKGSERRGEEWKRRRKSDEEKEEEKRVRERSTESTGVRDEEEAATKNKRRKMFHGSEMKSRMGTARKRRQGPEKDHERRRKEGGEAGEVV